MILSKAFCGGADLLATSADRSITTFNSLLLSSLMDSKNSDTGKPAIRVLFEPDPSLIDWISWSAYWRLGRTSEISLRMYSRRVVSPPLSADVMGMVSLMNGSMEPLQLTRNLKKPMTKTLGADRPVDEGSAPQATHVVDSTRDGNVETPKRRDVERRRDAEDVSTSIIRGDGLATGWCP
ncbi:hypothetical protein THAOC_24744 [Thalassiosira oceanica]|uniref:Uncharacterized protein n=1 Tax=Thalassiosira oceanica TaxID=159749 RepID=K0S3F7_THAOC|nr:hypothetical protein THAOC_24744 [Thalassiosira oceanica]|eukprot:EJK55521.1 hypothetical protein THAOC_24744 [Thalassiosira oceanica]